MIFVLIKLFVWHQKSSHAESEAAISCKGISSRICGIDAQYLQKQDIDQVKHPKRNFISPHRLIIFIYIQMLWKYTRPYGNLSLSTLIDIYTEWNEFKTQMHMLHGCLSRCQLKRFRIQFNSHSFTYPRLNEAYENKRIHSFSTRIRGKSGRVFYSLAQVITNVGMEININKFKRSNHCYRRKFRETERQLLYKNRNI